MCKVFVFNLKPQVAKDAFRVMGKQHSIPGGAATSPNSAMDHSVPSPVINRGEERRKTVTDNTSTEQGFLLTDTSQ